MTFPDILIAIAVTVIVGVVWAIAQALRASRQMFDLRDYGSGLSTDFVLRQFGQPLHHAPDEHAEQLFIGGTDRFHNGERK